ncbi:uncharacterized protein NPIL_255821 [Nephila pilipes]|uniref:Uncharacterized protein n=1 Tax=Nephila pilipes TaxID=299642 RepID=A0A8X6U6P2_NEPPI|nr:uncharacterized protein NPIL_255821 [Nephila pilipes]
MIKLLPSCEEQKHLHIAKMQYKVRKPKCTGVVCLKHQSCNKERRSSCTIVHIELVTSWPITVLWILLSWLVSTLATTAYVHPEWFVREHYSKHEMLNYDRDALVSTMGMVSVCYRGHDKKDGDELECHNFDEDFPSSSWQTSYVLFGSGCVLLTWCSILAFCNIWIIGKKNRQLVAMLIGRIQLVAVSFSRDHDSKIRNISPEVGECQYGCRFQHLTEGQNDEACRLVCGCL